MASKPLQLLLNCVIREPVDSQRSSTTPRDSNTVRTFSFAVTMRLFRVPKVEHFQQMFQQALQINDNLHRGWHWYRPWPSAWATCSVPEFLRLLITFWFRERVCVRIAFVLITSFLVFNSTSHGWFLDWLAAFPHSLSFSSFCFWLSILFISSLVFFGRRRVGDAWDARSNRDLQWRDVCSAAMPFTNIAMARLLTWHDMTFCRQTKDWLYQMIQYA